MVNIFESLSKEDSTTTSRQAAQEYIGNLELAIGLLKDIHSKNNSEFKAERKCATDIVMQTVSYNIGGDKVSFKMAFSCDSATPYAVEIIEESDNE